MPVHRPDPSPRPPAGARPVAGRSVGGRYRLESVLGRGAMGVVWAGRDELLQRDVAIKEVIFPSDVGEAERRALRARTMREARTAARISAEGAVAIFDVVEDDGRPWIVMERLPARTLAEELSERGTLPPYEVAQIGSSLLAGLTAAHAAGVLHRDVKPSNVMFRESLSGRRAVLGDFGIAHFDGDAALTTTTMAMGSPAYVAPERARGKPATPASDLWSLGVTLWAGVEGHSPFHRENALASLTAVLTEEVPAAEHAGPLRPLLDGLLRKDPGERIDAATARALLAEILTPEPPLAMDPDASSTQVLPVEPPGATPEGTAPPRFVPTGPSRGAVVGARGAGPRAAAVRAAAVGATAAPVGVPAAAVATDAPAAAAEPLAAVGADTRSTLVEPDRAAGAAGAAGAAAADAAPTGAPAEAPSPVGATTRAPEPWWEPARPEGSPPGPARRRATPLVVGALVLGLLGTGAVLLQQDERETPSVAEDQLAASSAPTTPVVVPETTAPVEPTASDPVDHPATEVVTEPTAPAVEPEPAPAPVEQAPQPEQPAVPEGFELYTDSTGFSIAVPAGWQASREGPRVYLKDPGSRAYLLVDQTDEPKDDPVADWKAQEPAVAARLGNYSRIGEIRSVDFRGWQAADWEFVFGQNQSTHVLNRNIVTSPSKAYALYWSVPSSQWETLLPVHEQVVASFQPAG